MPFLTLNGVTIPVLADSFVDTAERVGAIGVRAADGTRRDFMMANPRSWSARTTIRPFVEINALRRLLDGHGHVWHFENSELAVSGIGPEAGSSFTLNASGGKHGGRVNVSSGGAFSVDLGRYMFTRPAWSGESGFTLMVWKRLTVGDGGDGLTYYHHIATGSVNVTRGSSANPAGVTQYRNGVAGSYSMGNWISVSSSGVVGIHGYTNTNTAAAHDYDDLVVLPFAIPSAWADEIYTFHNAQAWSDIPRIVMSGDCVPVPTTVVGASGGMSQHNVTIDGAHTPTARALSFDLFEV